MSFKLEEIKEIRKKLGITQSDLAKRADVSQSLIAKIEAGRIDPTYTKVQKIFAALSDLGKKHELKAEEIMANKIIFVEPDDSLDEAIKKMKKYGISQMPVVEDHKSVGIISESIILETMLNKKEKMKVRDVMGESPPVVSKESTVTVISNLLKFYPLILVSEGGMLKGVITKSDLLGKMYGAG